LPPSGHLARRGRRVGHAADREQGSAPAFDLLGTRIAYGIGHYTREVPGLYVMKPDGSDARRITPDGVAAGDPAFSPNGALVAFTTSDGGPCQTSMIVDAEGATPPVPVPGSACGDRFARFSPDGSRIIHLSHGDVPGGPAAIVSRPLDGGPAHEVVPRGAEVGPFTLAFSPDGRLLALALMGRIYTLDMVTAELVERSQQDSGVAWSPIGPTLFFSKHTEDGSGSTLQRLDLGTPGAVPVPITDGKAADHAPSWGALGLSLPPLPVLDALPPLIGLLPEGLRPPAPPSPAPPPAARPRAFAARADRVIGSGRLESLLAIDPSGVRGLEVAIARQAGSRCRPVSGRRVARRPGRCRASGFRRMAVGDVATAVRRLPRGTYRVWLRATDGAGNRRTQMLRIRR
jgi:hypothetical protein